MIIGVTGKNGSGKSTVANILISRGFQYYSLSDILREHLKKINKPLSRENLIEVGNHLRETNGPDYLADQLAKKIDTDKNYVIDSIRNPSEVKRLQALSSFFFVNVEAPVELRFERCHKRKREDAEDTLQAFKAIEEKELEHPSPSAQQLTQTAELAEHTLQNKDSLENLEKDVICFLKECASKTSRPAWDDYFMDIAKVVSKRSNCVKRHVAAIIVKDKRIISTGYNGTPRGIKNCFEGGCPRCSSFGVSGKDLGECLCSHAEENAITQASYHGVSIKGSSLYTTFSPCLMCTKMIINSGIQEVVYDVQYSLKGTELTLLEETGIKVRPLPLR